MTKEVVIQQHLHLHLPRPSEDSQNFLLGSPGSWSSSLGCLHCQYRLRPGFSGLTGREWERGEGALGFAQIGSDLRESESEPLLISQCCSVTRCLFGGPLRLAFLGSSFLSLSGGGGVLLLAHIAPDKTLLEICVLSMGSQL